MKKAIITEYGGPEVLQIEQQAQKPEPKAGEVRVKVLFTTVNFTDIMIRKGMYPEVKQKPPFAPGYEMAGIVDKTGGDVTNFSEGQRVAAMTVIGASAEYLCVPAQNLVSLPETLDAKAATAVILTYTTAWQLLHRIARVKQGQRILIHGAGGAVGRAMLELGRMQGLHMYGTASKARHEMLAGYGATPIDYRNEDFVARIKNQEAYGLDAVFDPIGGSNFKKSFSLLRKGGTLVAYGFYNAVMGKGGNIPMDFMRLQIWNMLPNKRKAVFYSIGSLRKKHPGWFKADLQQLFRLLGEGKITPLIGQTFPLEHIVEAHKAFEESRLTGKILIQVHHEAQPG